MLDEHAHSSMQEAAKIARANGSKVATFAHNDPHGARESPGEPAAVSLRLGLHRRRLQHERHGPADGRAQRSRPGVRRRALHRRCPRNRRAGRAGEGDRPRSPGQLRQHVRRRVALQGVLVRRRFHRLYRAISSAAQDPLQPLCFRRAGRPLLSRSDLDGHRHPPLGRIRTRSARGSTRTSSASRAGCPTSA